MEVKSSLNSAKKSLVDFEYVDFEVKKESWNRYRLKDGAILKTKFVLISVLAEKGFKDKIRRAKTEKGIGVEFIFQSSNVMGVEVPPSLMGEPTTVHYSPQELEASVVEDEIDFETVAESWNVYRLNNEIYMKVRNSPIRVRRTNKSDSRGVPIYLVDFTADVKVLPKK
ncbi:MAG: hypothetical protein QMD23_05665 [Candidatus Bathyarchaeia archaeon]|nr:hypothetical protein [Candidatus Bathyarchaeia archaeon]